MAKTLGLRVVGGIDNPDSLDAILVPSTVNTSKLSGIVAAILAQAADAMFAVVDLGTRRVFAGPVEGLTPVVTINAMGGTTIMHELKQLGDGNERSDEWINAENDASEFTVDEGDADELEILVSKPQPVVQSLAQLIDKIEDIQLRNVASDHDDDPLGIDAQIPLIVVDQNTKKLTLFKVETGSIAAVRAAFAAAGALEAESAYEQIPAEKAVEGSQAFGL